MLFCVQQKKEIHRDSEQLQNFHLCVNYHFKIKVYLTYQQSAPLLADQPIEMTHTKEQIFYLKKNDYKHSQVALRFQSET